MSSESALTVIETRQEVDLGTLHASSAPALVAAASSMAKTLADVIDQQGLFTKIGPRKHVRVEGWTTLAIMLGCTPREVSNEAQEDGSYVATVELVRMRDGVVISRATSECGMDEPTWAGRARYARRSMAATRATGKACRLAFSWIMTLAGYDATPAEEVPHEERAAVARDVTPQRAQAPAPSPADEGSIKLAEASKITGAARERSEALGRDGFEVHGFRIVNHVLKDLGLEPAPPRAKAVDMQKHLAAVVTYPRLEPLLRGIAAYTPAEDAEEPPF